MSLEVVRRQRVNNLTTMCIICLPRPVANPELEVRSRRRIHNAFQLPSCKTKSLDQDSPLAQTSPHTKRCMLEEWEFPHSEAGVQPEECTGCVGSSHHTSSWNTEKQLFSHNSVTVVCALCFHTSSWNISYKNCCTNEIIRKPGSHEWNSSYWKAPVYEPHLQNMNWWDRFSTSWL